jgi:HKD family nuclease
MEFIDNDNQKLLKVIKQCLAWSENVDIAVAFVRQSGVLSIAEEICQIQSKGGQVRMLAGTDFGLTEPEAMSALQNFGVEVRVFSGSTIFHPKGYLFQKGKTLKAIIGSSNLSLSGLESGVEWNILLNSEHENLKELSVAFEKLWQSRFAKDLSDSVLKEVQTIYEESQSETYKSTILRKLDFTAELIQFLFAPGKAFFNYSHHPITIPRRYWNYQLKQIRTSKDCDIIIDFANEKFGGNIYTSVSGYGQFYQLRFDTKASRDISRLFETISSIKVAIRFLNNLIEIHLDRAN